MPSAAVTDIGRMPSAAGGQALWLGVEFARDRSRSGSGVEAMRTAKRTTPRQKRAPQGEQAAKSSEAACDSASGGVGSKRTQANTKRARSDGAGKFDPQPARLPAAAGEHPKVALEPKDERRTEQSSTKATLG